MAKLDLHRFPELRRQMSRRERDRNYMMARRDLGPHEGREMLDFWQDLAERIEEEEEISNVEHIISEIKSDIDMLKGLKQTLKWQRGDPKVEAKIAQVLRMIQMLIDIWEKFKGWHWHLRDEALAYFMAVNRAMPSKMKEKERPKKARKKGKAKSRRKAGQQKAKEAVDDQPNQAAMEKRPDPKKKRPTKKMQA